jgi:PmbA protein
MNFREIADAILNASPADQTEVVALENDESLTRFANNSIHQNVTERNTQIIVRAVIGTRVGIVNSNDLRPERLSALASRAVDLARLQPENPEFKGLPKPKAVSEVQVFDDAIANCSPAERADRVGVICNKAERAGFQAAGSMTTMSGHMGVANSEGVFAEFRSTTADMTAVVMGANSSGWAQATGSSLKSIEPAELADEAVQKVRIGVDPREFGPGEYTVILDPYATADILEMLAFDGMGALAVQEGRSWLNGRIGKKIMSSSINIVDDPLNKEGLPMPFDFEGMPAKAVSIVAAGVAGPPVYDSFTAGREEGRESTGHAPPPSATERYGPLPMHLFLKPGSASIESMIQSTKLGIYVTRFWYTRPVHPRDAVITGMTRDGTFLIRDGEIAHPIKSLRFTQSYLEALNHTEAIGSKPRVLRFGYGAASVPAVKLGQFRFTSSTR